MKKVLKKILLVILLIILVFAGYFFVGKAPQAEEIKWGVNFSHKHAGDFNLNWKETYLALLDDLKVKSETSPVYRYFTRGKTSTYISNTDQRRLVVDFIAGMTDDYFNNQFTQLFVPTSFGYSLSERSTSDN